MAKAASLFRTATRPATEEIEIPFTAMRKVAPERFEVVTGVVRGVVSDLKMLERNVSITVGRLTAQKSMKAQHAAAVAKLGLEVES